MVRIFRPLKSATELIGFTELVTWRKPVFHPGKALQVFSLELIEQIPASLAVKNHPSFFIAVEHERDIQNHELIAESRDRADRSGRHFQRAVLNLLNRLALRAPAESSGKLQPKRCRRSWLQHNLS